MFVLICDSPWLSCCGPCACTKGPRSWVVSGKRAPRNGAAALKPLLRIRYAVAGLVDKVQPPTHVMVKGIGDDVRLEHGIRVGNAAPARCIVVHRVTTRVDVPAAIPGDLVAARGEDDGVLGARGHGQAVAANEADFGADPLGIGRPGIPEWECISGDRPASDLVARRQPVGHCLDTDGDGPVVVKPASRSM